MYWTDIHAFNRNVMILRYSLSIC